MEVLKLVIYQPQAHYRVPFTFQRRHTYPLPPYSTVIGLLCNILGIKNPKGEGEPEDENYKKLRKTKISICGIFESKTIEYVWFRNLSPKSHNDRFGWKHNRKIFGQTEHPGGQQPVLIDVLNDVRLWIYLYHEDLVFLKNLENLLKKPVNRNAPLHLGRAEDLVVFEEIKNVELGRTEIGANFEKFFWIPEDLFHGEIHFEKIAGLVYKIPTFYILKNGFRTFRYVKVKLNNGEIELAKFGMYSLFDHEERLPVFLADFEKNKV